MAIATSHRHVGFGQRKPGLAMLIERERRRTEPFHVVAFFACIEIRRRRKLRPMLIGVAVGTLLKFHFEYGVFALGDVALRALQCSMLARKDVSGGLMIFEHER